MAKSCLPAFPLVVFGVVEPILLIWAYIVALRDPASYFAAQVPHVPIPSSEPLSPQSLALLLQLANVFLLLAALAVVCSWTAQASVARWYLVAVALADYGHVWACYRGVGAEVFWDTAKWNDVLWGGVAGSLVLNVLRWGTLVGAFGEIRDPRRPKGAAGKKAA
ncbi:hypothetical protein Daesc_008602 [Daldinia eschscholtzii]|uniref:DUF7704 domain-containing protein n=1 Tax=Daldinia eschscholtzii TaxID=292717 RepID=A0AAX6MCX5_9PEZI